VLIIEASQPRSKKFDGQRAFADLEKQVSFGPRIPGSEAHTLTVEYIREVLEENTWSVEIQDTTMLNQPVRNVIGRKGEGTPWIILGAHYDSRLKADRDPDPQKKEQPVQAPMMGRPVLLYYWSWRASYRVTLRGKPGWSSSTPRIMDAFRVGIGFSALRRSSGTSRDNLIQL